MKKSLLFLTAILLGCLNTETRKIVIKGGRSAESSSSAVVSSDCPTPRVSDEEYFQDHNFRAPENRPQAPQAPEPSPAPVPSNPAPRGELY